MKPVEVPSLDDLADRPDLAAGLPSATLTALFMRATVARTALDLALRARLTPDRAAASHDATLDAGELAARMHLSVFTIRRLAKRDPWRRCLVATGTRRLLFSRALVDETLRQQAGAELAGRRGGRAS